MNDKPATAEAVALANDVEALAVQIIQLAEGAEHEVYLAALLEAIRAGAAAFPCCAFQLGVLMASAGLEFQTLGHQNERRGQGDDALQVPATSTVH